MTRGKKTINPASADIRTVCEIELCLIVKEVSKITHHFPKSAVFLLR